ncbi:Polyisoprenoid-binding protein YceI [Filimonas lacunae]|uniref:Polyisoprenoid-binding protein YceI n=1 Tax=Filimonas lacunae TaxID=477680 RepID=A0A173MIT9_9BACT|nr:YceI family protein [Filimonas lacunae]BAV07331.1 rhodanese-like domain protein [Filimonas lacunae]SIS91237.1 Polyisoprenoid-binding protein YceI [Filimonas lacunae]
MATTTFDISSAQSTIDWVGRKVTGAHNGTILLKQGTLTFADGLLTGGRFAIDTTAITILDVTDPATNAQFAGHLASDDFFNSAQYPEAVFQVTIAEPRGDDSYHVTGELTIKGITHAISFDVQLQHNSNGVTASGKITIDRTKYGMKFRSGNFFTNLGDTLIYNNFDLHIHLTALAVA